MDRSRRLKVASRFSLLAAALAALFWIIWYLAAGSVPEVSEIALAPDEHVALPFAVSRWWDVPFAAAWAALAAIVLTGRRIREDGDLAVALAFALAFGLAFGLAYGIRAICSPSLWRRLGRWLVARPKEE